MEINEWNLFFNGCKYVHGAGTRIVLTNPHGDVIPISCQLNFYYTNNIVEYEDLIFGLKVAILLKVIGFKIFGDCTLIVKQVSNIYNIKYTNLKQYKEMVENILI